MKRIIFILTILISAVTANAQQSTATTPEQRAHTQALRVQKLVSASDEQTQKLEVIFLARANAINAITSDASKTDEQKKTEIAQVKADKDKEIAGVLTPDQYITYQNQLKAVQARQAAAGGQ
jgi:Spy/CpxP family protein refolding chaperone